jgi:hypothetical protein
VRLNYLNLKTKGKIYKGLVCVFSMSKNARKRKKNKKIEKRQHSNNSRRRIKYRSLASESSGNIEPKPAKENGPFLDTTPNIDFSGVRTGKSRSSEYRDAEAQEEHSKLRFQRRVISGLRNTSAETTPLTGVKHQKVEPVVDNGPYEVMGITVEIAPGKGDYWKAKNKDRKSHTFFKREGEGAFSRDEVVMSYEATLTPVSDCKYLGNSLSLIVTEGLGVEVDSEGLVRKLSGSELEDLVDAQNNPAFGTPMPRDEDYQDKPKTSGGGERDILNSIEYRGLTFYGFNSEEAQAVYPQIIDQLRVRDFGYLHTCVENVDGLFDVECDNKEVRKYNFQPEPTI